MGAQTCGSLTWGQMEGDLKFWSCSAFDVAGSIGTLDCAFCMTCHVCCSLSFRHRICFRHEDCTFCEFCITAGESFLWCTCYLCLPSRPKTTFTFWLKFRNSAPAHSLNCFSCVVNSCCPHRVITRRHCAVIDLRKLYSIQTPDGRMLRCQAKVRHLVVVDVRALICSNLDVVPCPWNSWGIAVLLMLELRVPSMI